MGYLILLALFIGVLVFIRCTNWLVNKYKLDILYGPKGVGKSTLLHKYAWKFHKKGWKIACNQGDISPGLFGPESDIVYNFPAADIGLFAKAYTDLEIRSKLAKKYEKLQLDHYYLEPHTLILIDEINTLWDNRDFAKFPDHANEYFRKQRHYKHKIIAFSQSFDQDAKIRRLTDHIVICRRIARCWVIGRSYQQTPIMAKSAIEEGAHKPADDYRKISLFPNYLCYLPHWIKKFNSFA